MSFIAAAIIGGGAAIVGGAIAAKGARNAASTQANAQNQASATQQGMFNQISDLNRPFVNTGYQANNQLAYLMGLGNPHSGGQSPSVNWQGVANDPAMQGFFKNTSWTPETWAAEAQGGMNKYFQGDPNKWLDAQNSLLKPYGAQLDGSKYISGMGNNDPQGKYSAGAASMGSDKAGMAQSLYGGGSMGPTDGGDTGGQGAFGSLTRNFTPHDFMQGMDPGYNFRLQQGGQALSNSMTPGVGALSGAALKSLMSFNQDMASQEYGNSFNRFQTQNNNTFARLSSLANMGQNSANNTGAQGATLGTGIAQSQAAAGASQAAGQVGVANAYSGAAQTAGMLPFYAQMAQRPIGGSATSGGGSATSGGGNAAQGIQFRGTIPGP